jgi:predicted RNase H-like HicB family nuclease
MSSPKRPNARRAAEPHHAALTANTLDDKMDGENGEYMKTFNAFIEWDPETKLYVGTVPGLPGAHTQAATLDELRPRLQEVIELCLEEMGDARNDLPVFVGIQQIEVTM